MAEWHRDRRSLSEPVCWARSGWGQPRQEAAAEASLLWRTGPVSGEDRARGALRETWEAGGHGIVFGDLGSWRGVPTPPCRLKGTQMDGGTPLSGGGRGTGWHPSAELVVPQGLPESPSPPSAWAPVGAAWRGWRLTPVHQPHPWQLPHPVPYASPSAHQSRGPEGPFWYVGVA